MGITRILAILSLLLLAKTLADSNVVNTRNGRIRGFYDDTTRVRMWNGVPFATPPTGENRLRIPKPHEPWEGVLDCVEHKNKCPQMKFSKESHQGDEDCLYLSVYKPERTQRKGPLPVFFWIYGGGWVFGDEYKSGLYDGRNFASQNDVIVVAANYRLGALGFLALDQLKKESGELRTTGNYALLDQRLALEWVRDNIGEFGGDPTQVVIVGESAGAFSVCFHLASNGSKGLFQGAIMQSGNCDSPYFWNTYEASVTWSTLYSKLVGCDASKFSTQEELTQCLRELPTNQIIGIDDGASTLMPFEQLDEIKVDLGTYVSELEKHHSTDGKHVMGMTQNPQLSATVSSLSKLQHLISQAKMQGLQGIRREDIYPILFPVMPWGASLDGSEITLSQTPLATISKGLHNRVPVILGSNQDEGTIFLFIVPMITGISLPLNENTLKDTVAHLFRQYKNETIPDLVLNQYPSENYKDQDDRGAKILRDYFFTCSARRTARALASHSENRAVYLYQYNYWSFIDGAFLGSYHAAEIPFVFANEWPAGIHTFNETDRKVSNAFGAYWSNFMATGNPNYGGKSVPLPWSAYNPTADINLDINREVTNNSNLYRSKCDFWDRLLHNLNHTVSDEADSHFQR